MLKSKEMEKLGSPEVRAVCIDCNSVRILSLEHARTSFVCRSCFGFSCHIPTLRKRKKND